MESKSFKTILIALFLLYGCAITMAAEKNNAEKNQQRLKNGDIVIDIHKNPITGIAKPTAQCLVNGSVQDVWYVITDFDSFGQFIPMVQSYRPISWNQERLITNCTVKIGLIKVRYKLSYLIDEKSKTTYWSYVKGSGPIRDAQGYWRVEPYDNTRVLVTYTTTMDVGKLMPGWIEDSLSKTMFPKVFKNLRERVGSLKQKGEIKKPVLRMYPDDLHCIR